MRDRVPQLDLSQIARPIDPLDQSIVNDSRTAERNIRWGERWPDKWPMLNPVEENTPRSSASASGDSARPEVLPTGIVRPHGWGLMLTALDECMESLLCEEDPEAAAECVVGVLPHVLTGAQDMLERLKNRPKPRLTPRQVGTASASALNMTSFSSASGLNSSSLGSSTASAQETDSSPMSKRPDAAAPAPATSTVNGRPLRRHRDRRPSSQQGREVSRANDPARMLLEPKLPRAASDDVPQYGDMLKPPGPTSTQNKAPVARKPPVMEIGNWQPQPAWTPMKDQWDPPMFGVQLTTPRQRTRKTGASPAAAREPPTSSSLLFQNERPKNGSLQRGPSNQRAYPDIIPVVTPSVTPKTSARDVLGGRLSARADSSRRARPAERQRSTISPLRYLTRSKSPERTLEDSTPSAPSSASRQAQMLVGPPRSVVRSESIDQLTDGILQRFGRVGRRGRPRASSAKRRLVPSASTPTVEISWGDDLDARTPRARERTEPTITPGPAMAVELSRELRPSPAGAAAERRPAGRARLRADITSSSQPRLQLSGSPRQQSLAPTTLLSDMPLPFKLPGDR